MSPRLNCRRKMVRINSLDSDLIFTIPHLDKNEIARSQRAAHNVCRFICVVSGMYADNL